MHGFDEESVKPENFSLTAKGMGFTYNQGTISAYAQGQFEVLLPFERFKDILKPDSPAAALWKSGGKIPWPFNAWK